MAMRDTPRDVEAIDNFCWIYFLDSLRFYNPESPYYNPKTQSIEFRKDEDGDTEYPGLLRIYDIFNIPEEHDLEYFADWEASIEKIIQFNPEATEAFEKLKLLDLTLIPSWLRCSDRGSWNERVNGFLKGLFDDFLTCYDKEIIRLMVRHAFEIYTKDLSKFYLPSVEI